jgi:hypothetical protein
MRPDTTPSAHQPECPDVRLHVIVGDSNMSEATTLLKVDATDLVLRSVEAGVVMRDLTLENPIRAIRDVSHDMTGRSKVRLASGREASSLEIQSEYFTRAKDFVERRVGDAVIARVLGLWERTLRAVETQDLDLVAREIDWVTKFQLIERYRAKRDLPLSSPRVAELDLAYHDVHRGRGSITCWSGAGRWSGWPGIWRSSRPAATSPSTGVRHEAERPSAAHKSCPRTRSGSSTSGSTN